QGRVASALSRQDKRNVASGAGLTNRNTHQFGGTAGGPVFLPRFGEGTPYLYDGRNRSFFFVATEFRRNATPIFGGTGDPQAVPVPTARMRVGDFSELLRPGTSRVYQLANGGTVTAPIGTIFSPEGVPIPGNDLRNCPSCGGFSPFALAYVNAFPLPNLPGAGRNFRTNRKEGYNLDSYDVKIDHNFTDNNRFFARYSRSTSARQRDNFFPLGASPNGNDLPAGPSAGDEFGNARGFTMGDTHTFGGSVVNDARFGFTRVDIGIFNTGVNGTGGFDPNVSANLGARNINLGPTSSGIILFGIVDELTGTDRATEFTGDGGPFYFTSNNFSFADGLTWVRGTSTFKFGGDLRVRQNSNFDAGRAGAIKGQYQYGTGAGGFLAGNYSGIPIGPQDSGSGQANFLLGYNPAFTSRGTPGTPPFLSNKEIAFFGQDDWKVSPTLTLNLGLRWDLFTQPTERFDAQANYNPANDTLTRAGEGAPGGRDLVNSDKNNFGPSAGFAWSGLKEDKTVVVRGGYALKYAVDTPGIPGVLQANSPQGGGYSCSLQQYGTAACPQLPARFNLD
ncbi:MAG TPA: TonB-dependent receptor, partial [Pyrinomonadaceae bacterium]